jgi:DNA invertase Pin-like site-specific DNA recombinase
MYTTAIYVRQSINLQEGIDRQLIRTRALAGQRGWTVAGEYLDNDTSATKARGHTSAWARMLNDAAAGTFTHVIAVDLDRLLRSQRDRLTLLDSGLKVVTVDGELDLSTADGEFRASIMASVARFEVRRKSERQKRAGDHRASLGIPQSGKRPFGYEADLRTLYEPEVRWLRFMFERVDSDASVNDLARDLLRLGSRTVTRAEWSTNTIKRVMLRPRNAGIMARHGVIVGPAIIEPVVPLDVWKRVRESFTLHSHLQGIGDPTSWLSLLILCGSCGRPMRRAGKRTKGRGPEVKTRIYRCVQALDRIHSRDRTHCSILAHLVEEAVDDYCQDVSLGEQSRAAGRFLTWRNLTFEEKRTIVRVTLCIQLSSEAADKRGSRFPH